MAIKSLLRDPIALAKLVGDIATGQAVDTVDDAKNPAAVALGRRGGAGPKPQAGAATRDRHARQSDPSPDTNGEMLKCGGS